MWNRFPVPENPQGLILSRIGWNGAENETGWGPENETGWGRGQNATGWGQPWGCPWAGGCLGLARQRAKPWFAHASRVMTVETPGPVIEELFSDTASTCSSWTVVSQNSTGIEPEEVEVIRLERSLCGISLRARGVSV